MNVSLSLSSLSLAFCGLYVGFLLAQRNDDNAGDGGMSPLQTFEH